MKSYYGGPIGITNALLNGNIPDPLRPPLPQDWGLQLSYPLYQWRIQDLPRGDHGEREEREPKWGSGGGAPSGFTRWRVRGAKPPEAESFLYIFIQKVVKS